MNFGKNIFKAGKLIKVVLKYDEAIQEIKIYGDFFIYPEDAIEKIQKQLIGTKVDKLKIKQKLDEIIEKEEMEPFGFNSEQLAEAIFGACK